MKNNIFKQAKQNRIFEDVINQIQEAILNGKLKTGDKLPAERELKEMLSVSRGTLREALRVLELKGLIKIKTGVNGGAIVQKATTQSLTESLGLLIRHQQVLLKDLAEFREGVEGIVTGLATERATPKDIINLKTILDEARILLEKGISHWDDFINIDNKVHMELARIAGNPLYESVLKTIHDNIIRYYNRLLPKKPAILKKNYLDLCEIIKAVENKQASKADSLAREHVGSFTKLMSRQGPSQKNHD